MENIMTADEEVTYFTDTARIEHAMQILEGRLRKYEVIITSPTTTTNYLKLRLAQETTELFLVMFLTNQHHLIEAEVMFRGTIDSCVVYPREIVKRALTLNAAAVIFAHNHPSGVATPSGADRQLTDKLVTALGTVDIRVLDHFVIGGDSIKSFAELGYL